MAQGLPALAAEQEAQGQHAGPRAGARRRLIPGIGSDLSAVPRHRRVREIRCGRWATATSDRTTRDPGQLSVRLSCLDVRLELSTQPSARCCSALTWHGRAGSRGVQALGLPTGGLSGRHGL
ncbi:DUF6207 family protein [Streptomyces coeruleofuscus]|uniref:DUF6207 family protein n=1 Tax=Streptomyces coeruleofuscus TaxID=66879 RepID=UPI003D156B96